MFSITDLRCQVPRGVLAIGAEPVRLTWRIEPAGGWVDAGGLRDRGLRRPGLRDDHGCERHRRRRWPGRRRGTWSAASQPRGALLPRSHPCRLVLDRSEPDPPGRGRPAARPRTGRRSAVTLPEDPGAVRQSPAPILRREFELPGAIARARLYVTSLGVHEVLINGRPVSDALLSPGWTTYRHRLLSETHDVTRAARARARTPSPPRSATAGIAAGSAGTHIDDRCRYGDQLGLVAQLEVGLADGSCMAVATDESWRASTGEVLAADLYDGCTHRPPRAPARDGHRRASTPRAGAPSASSPLDRSIIEPRVAPPVRVVAELPARRTAAARRRAPARRGPEHRRATCGCASGATRDRGWSCVTRRCSSRTGRCTRDRSGLRRRPTPTSSRTTAETVLEPRMTFHGFRYAEVETDATVLDATFVAISSDTRPRAGVQPAPTRCSSGSTRTSRGRSATTSSRCPPTARSGTSVSAGPATPRPSRRPARRCSTRRPSGHPGCATSRSTRTTSSACRRSCPTSWS